MIRIKLIALFLMAAVVPFMVVGLLVFLNFRQALVDSELQQMDALASIQKQRVQSYIGSNNVKLTLFQNKILLKKLLKSYLEAKMPQQKKAAQDTIRQNIQDTNAQIQGFRNIDILDTSGRVIVATDQTIEGQDHSQLEYFQKGQDNNDVATILRNKDQISVYLTGPLTMDGKKIGVVVIETDSKDLYALFAGSNGLGASGDWGLSKKTPDGQKGLIVVPSKFDKDPMHPLVATFPLDSNLPAAKALKGQEKIFTDIVDYRGKEVLATTRYIPEVGWGLSVKVEKAEAFAAIYRLETQLISFTALIIIFVLFIGSFLTQLIVSPILKLTRLARRVKDGDLRGETFARTHDEVSELADSFNSMLLVLREQQYMVKQLDQQKDEFLSIAAHHLRTPLGTLRWSLELLLKEKFGKLPRKVKVTLLNMALSNLGLIALVNQLLDVSRINQGKVIDHPQVFKVVDLVQKLVSELQIIADKKAITLNLKLGNTDGLTLNLDPQLFSQVIGNVLSNSIKYSKDHSKVDIALEKSNTRVKIIVSDNGIGIPQEDLGKVFNKFYRAGNVATLDYEGTGLGLYVVKSYLEKWGGQVSLESTEGSGTTVTMELPIS